MAMPLDKNVLVGDVLAGSSEVRGELIVVCGNRVHGAAEEVQEHVARQLEKS